MAGCLPILIFAVIGYAIGGEGGVVLGIIAGVLLAVAADAMQKR